MKNELTEKNLIKHHERMNHILKNKFNQIARVFIDLDYKKTGKIDYTSMHNKLRLLGFSEKVLPDSDIQYIYNKYQVKDEDTFNYPNFLRDLKDFDYKFTDLRVKIILKTILIFIF